MRTTPDVKKPIPHSRHSVLWSIRDGMLMRAADAKIHKSRKLRGVSV